VNLNQIITEEYKKLLVEKKKNGWKKFLKIFRKELTIFKSESNYNKKTYIYIPQGTDLTKANVVIHFHGDNGVKSGIKALTTHFRKANHRPNTIIVVPHLGRTWSRKQKRRWLKKPKKHFIDDIKKEIKKKNPDLEIKNFHLMAYSAGGAVMDRFIMGGDEKKPTLNLSPDMLHKSRITYFDGTWGQWRTKKILKSMHTLNLLKKVHIVTCTRCQKRRTYRAAKNLRRWVKNELQKGVHKDDKIKLNWTPVPRKHGWFLYPQKIPDKYLRDKTISKFIPEPKLEPVQLPEPEPIQPSEAEPAQPSEPEHEPGVSFEDYMFDMLTDEGPEYAGVQHYTGLPELEPGEPFEDYIFDVPTGKEPEYAEIRYDAELPEPEFTQIFEPEEELEDELKYNPPVLTAKKLIKLVQERFDQILDEQTMPLIKVDVILKYEKDFSFYGNVLNQIRSIKGVAIAKASDIGVVDVGADKRMVLMHLKFMPDRPMHQYLTYLQMELKKLKDKNGNRVLATQIKGIPREIEI